jgi:hypothetical protein
MEYLDGSAKEPEKMIKATDKDGKEISVLNPDYARWIAQDQTVLSYLLRNMTREILTQLVGLTTSAAVWTKLTEMFSSQSKARIVHLRTQINKTKRENFASGATYFDRIKSLADEMSTAGKPQDDDDIASYVLAGLDDQYNGFVAAITALIRARSVSLGDLYSQFLAYESRLDDQQPGNSDGSELSANAASRGNYGGRNRGGRNAGGGRGNPGGRGQYNGGNQNYGNYGGGGYQGGYQQRQGGGRSNDQQTLCNVSDL